MKEKEKNRHHIIPSSRNGADLEDNTVMVVKEHHQHYHSLFFNRTPVEIIVYLVNHFWKGNWTWVEQALERRNNDATDVSGNTRPRQ